MVYKAGTSRGVYSGYMSWFIKQVQVEVCVASTCGGLYGGYMSWDI